MSDSREDVWRAALEKIAGPPDRPNLSYDGRLAAKALGRNPASPEAIAARARRDYDQYVGGIPLLSPQLGSGLSGSLWQLVGSRLPARGGPSGGG